MSDADAMSGPPGDDMGGSEAPVFQLATWLQRFAATLIDGGITYLIILVATFFGDSILATLLTLAAVAFALWQLWNQGVTGQTIGKKALKIKLVSENNAQVVGGWYSIGRSFVHIVDSPCYIGFLWPLWDKKRQTFADKIMKTVVITAP